MNTEKIKIDTVEKYIAGFPPKTQKLLKQLRATIRENAQDANEVISYQMPAYKFHGMLLYFACHEKHIGFYPMAATIAKFRKKISNYKTSKGTVQFPLDQPLPLELISEMVKFRVKENLKKVKAKKK